MKHEQSLQTLQVARIKGQAGIAMRRSHQGCDWNSRLPVPSPRVHPHHDSITRSNSSTEVPRILLTFAVCPSILPEDWTSPYRYGVRLPVSGRRHAPRHEQIWTRSSCVNSALGPAT